MMDVQIAGPSSIPTGLDSQYQPFKERQRQMASNQKAERVFGTPVPASFLKHGIIARGAMTEKTDGKTISLNSPISRCPTSILPWNPRLPQSSDTTISALPLVSEDSAPSPAANTIATVPPLNFKRRTQRRSFSMAKIETGLTDYKRDAAPFVNESNMHNNSQPDSHLQRAGEPGISRRQSLPETTTSAVLPSNEAALKRPLRPLPPVPTSRSASPTSSNSSHQSHNGPRPLPNPPFRLPRVPVPSVTPSMLVPVNPDSPPTDSSSAESTPPRETAPLRLSVKVKRESDLFSPLSPLSLITDLPKTLRIPVVPTAPSPRSSEARKRHRIHASPYKLTRNPTRFSTTSLSSQVSVPPVPSPAELRRRNREKMAKLIRVLGESPPSDLVFAAERERERTSVDSENAVEEESAENLSKTPITFDPIRRSVSLGIGDSTTSLFGKKKALSDPNAGHGIRAQSPPGVQSPSLKPTSFLRRRSKRGRADKDNVPRYVVSLFDAGESKTSERLTFKLHAKTPETRPAGSYLRGAYKYDVKCSELKTPPLPKKIPGIDLPRLSQKWVRDSRQNRWEVDDYENVVASLRKL
ncbi:hypothetical protein A7U60_g8132 [Sanghuangporus baumii]|uniref:Uncharacterized protein n=1 Tax=Sanghuangporus baumii TaxID=108892 RepID=A0A9Q5HS03_SANBA|nr:hypothetical protein A7U60_g8132 [Sanghuangporus baumii]